MSDMPLTSRFQSTLPARGATCQMRPCVLRSIAFQSTLPARGATYSISKFLYNVRISIHAPRTGSDRGRRGIPPCPHHFNPRSPHGERRGQARRSQARREISIHAPRTGSDTDKSVTIQTGDISIHAPRTGSDGGR